MTDRHQYKVTVTWTGNTGSGTSDYRAYDPQLRRDVREQANDLRVVGRGVSRRCHSLES